MSTDQRHKLRELQEQRAGQFEELKTLLESAAAEGRDLTAEEQQTEARLNSALDAGEKVLSEARDRAKTLADLEQRQAEANEQLRTLLGREPEQRENPTVDPQAELRSFFKGESGRAKEFRAAAPMGTAEYRTLSKLTAGAGANTVQTSFYNRLTAHLIEVSGVLNAGPTVLSTATGESMQFPKTTGHSSAALVAEAGTLAASDPAFGQVTMDAFKYGLLLQLSHELVNDTSVDLMGYVAMQAGRALGNAFGAHLVTGTGSAQPNGVVTAASVGITGAASVSGAFSADNLIDLKYSVIEPYRRSQSCGWLMRDATVAAVRKLKDTTNQYLWQPSLVLGEPDTLLGHRIYTDPNVAAVALSAKSVVFGDFSQYFVRRVEALRFERSDDFAFSSDLVTYRAIIRGDGDLIDTTGALKIFQGNAA